MASKKELAAELQKLIYRYSAKGKAVSEAAELKAALAYCVSTVLRLEHTGRALQKDYKRDGLSINAVEAEGFVRGCITVKEELTQWSEQLADLVKEEEAQYRGGS